MNFYIKKNVYWDLKLLIYLSVIGLVENKKNIRSWLFLLLLNILEFM